MPPTADRLAPPATVSPAYSCRSPPRPPAGPWRSDPDEQRRAAAGGELGDGVRVDGRGASSAASLAVMVRSRRSRHEPGKPARACSPACAASTTELLGHGVRLRARGLRSPCVAASAHNTRGSSAGLLAVRFSPTLFPGDSTRRGREHRGRRDRPRRPGPLASPPPSVRRGRGRAPPVGEESITSIGPSWVAWATARHSGPPNTDRLEPVFDEWADGQATAGGIRSSASIRNVSAADRIVAAAPRTSQRSSALAARVRQRPTSRLVLAGRSDGPGQVGSLIEGMPDGGWVASGGGGLPEQPRRRRLSRLRSLLAHRRFGKRQGSSLGPINVHATSSLGLVSAMKSCRRPAPRTAQNLNESSQSQKGLGTLVFGVDQLKRPRSSQVESDAERRHQQGEAGSPQHPSWSRHGAAEDLEARAPRRDLVGSRGLSAAWVIPQDPLPSLPLGATSPVAGTSAGTSVFPKSRGDDGLHRRWRDDGLDRSMSDDVPRVQPGQDGLTLSETRRIGATMIAVRWSLQRWASRSPQAATKAELAQGSAGSRARTAEPWDWKMASGLPVAQPERFVISLRARKGQ